MHLDEIISKSILQVRKECSFFGALMMFAKIQESETIETAATDGSKIIGTVRGKWTKEQATSYYAKQEAAWKENRKKLRGG